MLKTVNVVVRGTVYTKCVCTVPIAEVDIDNNNNIIIRIFQQDKSFNKSIAGFNACPA